MKKRIAFLLITFLFLIVSCGGGGNGVSENPSPLVCKTRDIGLIFVGSSLQIPLFMPIVKNLKSQDPNCPEVTINFSPPFHWDIKLDWDDGCVDGTGKNRVGAIVLSITFDPENNELEILGGPSNFSDGNIFLDGHIEGTFKDGEGEFFLNGMGFYQNEDRYNFNFIHNLYIEAEGDTIRLWGSSDLSIDSEEYNIYVDQTDPLVFIKNNNCPYPISGTIFMQIDNENVEMDFNTGDCYTAVVTTDEESDTVTLP